jgi:hypothetical protein
MSEPTRRRINRAMAEIGLPVTSPGAATLTAPGRPYRHVVLRGGVRWRIRLGAVECHKARIPCSRAPRIY